MITEKEWNDMYVLLSAEDKRKIDYDKIVYGECFIGVILGTPYRIDPAQIKVRESCAKY